MSRGNKEVDGHHNVLQLVCKTCPFFICLVKFIRIIVLIFQGSRHIIVVVRFKVAVAKISHELGAFILKESKIPRHQAELTSIICTTVNFVLVRMFEWSLKGTSVACCKIILVLVSPDNKRRVFRPK